MGLTANQVLMMIWHVGIAHQISNLAMIYTAQTWFFQGGMSAHQQSAPSVAYGYWIAFRYHLGTCIYAGLVILLISPIRLPLKILTGVMQSKQNNPVGLLLWVCFSCVEDCFYNNLEAGFQSGFPKYFCSWAPTVFGPCAKRCYCALFRFFRWELVGGVANVTACHCSLPTDRMLRFKCVTHLSLCFGLFRLMLRPPLSGHHFLVMTQIMDIQQVPPLPPHKTSTVLIIPVHKDHKGCWRST